jgi:phospholipid N-methyltransferase
MNRQFSVYRRRIMLALAALPVARLAGAADDIDSKRTGGPFVPTPQVVVDEMLRMGKVGADDFIVDLGSGDGVIVLTAATRLKARGFGVDIDPRLVRLSNDEAKRRGVADRASFHVQDVFKTDISKATVVTLYLLPGMMAELRPKIFNELKPGARVVSHDYSFDEWTADDQFTWDVPEKEAVNGVPRATVYLWIVPARVEGRWRLRLSGPVEEKYELTLRQSYQNLEGAVTAPGGRVTKLSHSRMRGEQITFAFPVSGDRHLFRGRAGGDAMEGTVQLAGEKALAKWTASRIRT